MVGYMSERVIGVNYLGFSTIWLSCSISIYCNFFTDLWVGLNWSTKLTDVFQMFQRQIYVIDKNCEISVNHSNAEIIKINKLVKVI